MIRLRNITKNYRQKTVLDVDECTFEPGHIHILVGHNGSGKTTLLKIVNHLIAPDSGQVENSYNRLEMVLCHQNPFLFDTTVAKNIRFGLRFRKKHNRIENPTSLFQRLRIDSLLQRNAKTLSTGEAQRVALARALVVNPQLLLLDEPTANLDPESVECIENEILRFPSEGNTVVMVTHRVEKAFHLSDRVKRLEKGRIVASEVRNVFEGTVKERDESAFFVPQNHEGFFVVTPKRGSLRVAVPPTDIILSEHPLTSSMRNCFAGRVIGLMEVNGKVNIQVDAGMKLDVFVTHESVAKMKLTIGSKVYASFKATAVKIF